MTDEATAERFYQRFKWDVIAPIEADRWALDSSDSPRLAGVGGGGDGRRRAPDGGGELSARRLLGAHLPAASPERRETGGGGVPGLPDAVRVDARRARPPPGRRPHRLVDALIVWITPDRALEWKWQLKKGPLRPREKGPPVGSVSTSTLLRHSETAHPAPPPGTRRPRPQSRAGGSGPVRRSEFGGAPGPWDVVDGRDARVQAGPQGP